MLKEITNLFNILRFTAGRYISIYNQLEPLLQNRQLADVVAYMERARRHAELTSELDARWLAPERRSLYSPEANELDPRVDALLVQIRDTAVSQIEDLDEQSPLRARVQRMLDTCFPAGVNEVIKLPYIDQAPAVERIVGKLQSEFANEIGDLALGRKVQRLAVLSTAYRAAVDGSPGVLEFATVQESRERDHVYLLEIVSMILGKFHDSDNPEHLAARAELVEPILAHNDQVRESRRRGRTGAEPALPGTDDPPDATEPGPVITASESTDSKNPPAIVA